MTFRRGARLDPGQVRDVRGQRSGGLPGLGGMFGGGGGGGGSALPIPAGGGIIGLIIVLVVLFLIFNGGLGGLGGGTGANTGDYPIDDTRGDQTLAQNCQTGEDANARAD